MAKPYSNDLRARVVSDIAEAATTRAISAPRSSVDTSPTSLAAHEKLVRRLVAQQPDITLAEIRAQLTKQKIKVGQSSIFRFLRHLNLTFKKKPSRRRTESSRRRG